MSRRKEVSKNFTKICERLIENKVVANKSQLANQLGTYTGDIAKIANPKNNREVSLDKIITLFKRFGDFTTPNELFGFESREDNISFLLDANAGGSISIDSNSYNNKFRIPGLFGEHLAFRVSGDSMFPTLLNGDILICKEIRNREDIKDNNIYVVASNEGLNVKRLRFDKKISDGITLISDNEDKCAYPPIEIDLSFGLHNNPTFKIYQSIKRITESGVK